MMTAVELESAATELPQEELRQLVSRLQIHVEAQGHKVMSGQQFHEAGRTHDQEKHSSEFQAQMRKQQVMAWLEELQRIGRRIEAKAQCGPTMVELVNEGRNRCS